MQSKPKQSSSSNIDLKGFQSHVQLGFAWHVSGEMPLQFSYTGGFRLNNTLFIGLGAGYKLPLGRPNNNINISEAHTSDYVLLDCGNGIPLFLNSRIYMSKGKCKPYLSLSGGIELRGKNMIFIHDNIEGQETLTNSVPFKQNSFYIDPAFGLDFRMKGKSSFNIELGSQMTSSPYYRLSSTGTYGLINPLWKFGISARIGFTF